MDYEKRLFETYALLVNKYGDTLNPTEIAVEARGAVWFFRQCAINMALNIDDFQKEIEENGQ